jgi:hypothetical protein
VVGQHSATMGERWAEANGNKQAGMSSTGENKSAQACGDTEADARPCATSARAQVQSGGREQPA